MRRRGIVGDGKKFIEETRARQRNTIWPDPLVNSRGVDELIWNGSPNATIVQRIGVALFGLFDLGAGLVFLSFARKERSLLLVAISIGCLLLGTRVLLNAFTKNDRNKRSP